MNQYRTGFAVLRVTGEFARVDRQVADALESDFEAGQCLDHIPVAFQYVAKAFSDCSEAMCCPV